MFLGTDSSGQYYTGKSELQANGIGQPNSMTSVVELFAVVDSNYASSTYIKIPSTDLLDETQIDFSMNVGSRWLSKSFNVKIFECTSHISFTPLEGQIYFALKDTGYLTINVTASSNETTDCPVTNSHFNFTGLPNGTIVNQHVDFIFIELDPGLNYADAESHAQSLGGRLPTIDEAKFYALYAKQPTTNVGQAYWLPVTNDTASDGRDYVTINNGNPALTDGSGHIDYFGHFPGWADNSADNI